MRVNDGEGASGYYVPYVTPPFGGCLCSFYICLFIDVRPPPLPSSLFHAGLRSFPVGAISFHSTPTQAETSARKKVPRASGASTYRKKDEGKGEKETLREG